MSDSVRFYIDDDPATAGDRKFLARREKGGAGLCYFGETLKEVEAKVAEKEVEAKVADRIAREAAWAPPAAPAARKPLLNAKARSKAAPAGEAVDG